jgi:hypothetical protein
MRSLRCIKLVLRILKNLDESLHTNNPAFREFEQEQIHEILDFAAPKRFGTHIT